MNNNTKEMTIGISKINLILGVIILVTISFTQLTNVIPFLIGNIIATINFILNAIIMCFVLEKNKYSTLIGLSFFVRVLIIASVAILFLDNIPGLILYIFAIIIQQISIVIYGFTSSRI